MKYHLLLLCLISFNIADVVANQCCSDETPECCISLTYSSSVTAAEDVPAEFGGSYYCETFAISKTSACDDLDYIVLPLSKACDLTLTIWDLEGADGFAKAQLLADGTIVLNNADEFLLSPDDEDNPTGYHAFKFPLDMDVDNASISICSQLAWGDVIDSIEGEEVQIGFDTDDGGLFSCSNDTIRDLCSIDTSFATYSAQQAPMNVINIHQHKNNLQDVDEVDDPRFDNLFNRFEFYWDKWVGLGIAVFAASIFFNFVMCIYWSGLKVNYIEEKKLITKKVVIDEDGDDVTEEESDDTDLSDADDPQI